VRITNCIKQILGALIIASLSACGGGGGGSDNNDSTAAKLSNGEITNFGSVFVNGVEYNTDTAVFIVDDFVVGGVDTDNFNIGMRVKVKGSVNPDGVTGIATSVEFDDLLEGPVNGAASEDADGLINTLTVLGIPVLVDKDGTSFLNTSYDDLATTSPDGKVLKISGFFDASNQLHAVFIEKKTDTFTAPADEVELKGVITAIGANTFELNYSGNATVTVNTNIGTDLTELPGGVVQGTYVEVEGTIPDKATATITANKIEFEDNEFGGDGQDIEFEGIVTRFVSLSDFDVEGVTVNAGTAVTIPANITTLIVGDKVEVEGTTVGTVIQAVKLKKRSGRYKIHALVSAVTTTSFSLEPVSGGNTITVTVDTSTEMEDKVGVLGSSYGIGNVDIGHFLQVRGFADGDPATARSILATRVRRESVDDVILEGVIQSFTANTDVTVLGVAFPVVTATTEYQDQNNDPIIESLFDTNTTNGQSVVKIKDRESGGDLTPGLADTVEIQS